jgi:hypothetical protein
MARNPWKTAPFGPAAVAIHDNGYMGRNPGRIERKRQLTIPITRSERFQHFHAMNHGTPWRKVVAIIK